MEEQEMTPEMEWTLALLCGKAYENCNPCFTKTRDKWNNFAACFNRAHGTEMTPQNMAELATKRGYL